MKTDVASYVPRAQFSDEEIRSQVRHCEKHGWAMIIEFTHDPSPSNHYWDRWGVPMLEPDDPDVVLFEIKECRKSYPDRYIRLIACEAGKGQPLIRHVMMVHRPRA